MKKFDFTLHQLTSFLVFTIIFVFLTAIAVIVLCTSDARAEEPLAVRKSGGKIIIDYNDRQVIRTERGGLIETSTITTDGEADSTYLTRSEQKVKDIDEGLYFRTRPDKTTKKDHEDE